MPEESGDKASVMTPPPECGYVTKDGRVIDIDNYHYTLANAEDGVTSITVRRPKADGTYSPTTPPGWEEVQEENRKAIENTRKLKEEERERLGEGNRALETTV
jgi:hypothetical protein